MTPSTTVLPAFRSSENLPGSVSTSFNGSMDGYCHAASYGCIDPLRRGPAALRSVLAACDSEAGDERRWVVRHEDHVHVRRVDCRNLPQIELCGARASKVVESFGEADRFDGISDGSGMPAP